MNSKKLLTGVLITLWVLATSLSAYPSATSVALSEQDQPYMMAAIADLEKAQRALQEARANKGGHRLKALEYVEKAITEVNKGIEYDRTHENAAVSLNEVTFVKASFLAQQPRMRAALEFLQSAQSDLQKATADKGGHRVKALDYISKAIIEVNQGMAYAN